MFECNSLALYERFERKQGISSLLFLNVSLVAGDISRNSSLLQKYRGLEVNNQVVYTIRSSVGHGYAGTQKFNTLMNIPKRATEKTIAKKFKKWYML